MRKRNNRVYLRLDENEYSRFQELVKKSGLTQSAYLRHLINNRIPREAPPPDYFAMMRELYAVGNNLNQIAQKAHVLGVMDVKRYDEAVQLFANTVKEITEAVIVPQRMK